jgi:hypothetical protein
VVAGAMDTAVGVVSGQLHSVVDYLNFWHVLRASTPEMFLAAHLVVVQVDCRL